MYKVFNDVIVVIVMLISAPDIVILQYSRELSPRPTAELVISLCCVFYFSLTIIWCLTCFGAVWGQVFLRELLLSSSTVVIAATWHHLCATCTDDVNIIAQWK